MNETDTTVRLANYIFSGKAKPGERLIERDLCEILGISRIPVREALGKLIAKGVLVRDDFNRSVCMREYDSQEVRDLLECREAIEIASVRMVCEKSTAQSLVYFEVLCDQMMEEVGSSVSARWTDLDRRFHQSLVEASGNRRFINDFAYLVSESHYVFYVHPNRKALLQSAGVEVEKHMRQVIDDHLQVVSALRDRNVQKAVDSLRQHLRTASGRLSREILSAESKLLINRSDSRLMG